MSDSSRFRLGTTEDVRPLLDTVHRYTSGELGALPFVLEFRTGWGDQRFVMPPGLFDVLEKVFYGTEDFVADDDLREPGDLDADGLFTLVTSLEPELVARFEDARRREAGTDARDA